MKWNHLSNDLIYPDQKLTILNKETYVVKNGDTIWDIANNYNVTVDQLKQWNNLTADLIHPNDELVVYPEEDTKKASKDDNESKKVESSSVKNASVATKPVTKKQPEKEQAKKHN